MLNFQLIKLSFDDDDGISGSWEVWTIVIIFVIICQLVTIEDKRKTGIIKKMYNPLIALLKCWCLIGKLAAMNLVWTEKTYFTPD